MQFTVNTWDEFSKHWGGVINFLMAGEVASFEFDLPPLREVVDQIRLDEKSRILSGVKSATFDRTDIKEEFQKQPIDEALDRPFNLGLFDLSRLQGEGQPFYKLSERWVQPWQDSLRAQGFTWREMFPIVFVSGKGCATNYHMDASHVMAWQRYGTKIFTGLKEPDRWSTPQERVSCSLDQTRPAAITQDDMLAYEMPPGSVLWNAIATPHWVDACDEVAMTMSMVHRGLRQNGKLCAHEEEMQATAKSAGAGEKTDRY